MQHQRVDDYAPPSPPPPPPPPPPPLKQEWSQCCEAMVYSISSKDMYELYQF